MTATKLRKREEDVLAFLACHAEGARSQQVADALGITYAYASLILSTLFKLGRCRRPRHGLYAGLNGGAARPAPNCRLPPPPPEDITVTDLDRLIADVDEIHTRLDRIMTLGPRLGDYYWLGNTALWVVLVLALGSGVDYFKKFWSFVNLAEPGAES